LAAFFDDLVAFAECLAFADLLAFEVLAALLFVFLFRALRSVIASGRACRG